ncbi:hypothetical protein PBT90_04165 [Algoriphagus halophytocola]|uniref:Outer membrane protein beta-barrel domain-containing protein n=1 Tax=Algoriphagus halophytocola TaxID=2991499 RepID=A0ABY6MFL3_9BACT|nr:MULTISPECIES: hypothetical protein [unclassified Algoriphagus]UZD22613.1 hypothetical protein OM944_18425 [Algoriphagus sp. TR-M5]WBL43879.1 hypothetical protein PBT90_04165 [Algoriphagus sp. TR-M9]
MSLLFRYSFLLLLTICTLQVNAQNFYKEKQSRDNIVSIGVGPSFIYMDNGGQYRTFNFEFNPSISASLTKRLTDRFDVKATGGMQWISSGGNPSQQVTDYWTANNSSFTANGTAYYFDLMPTVYLVPFGNHMNRSMFNFYFGLGLGVLHANTEQTKSFSEDEVPVREKVTTGYVPIRGGITYTIGAYSDIALEGTMLATFTDNIDGNVGFNKFGDHLLQAQIVYRRYLFSDFSR